MIVDEFGRPVRITLTDGRIIEADAEISAISYINDSDDRKISSGPFNYLIVSGKCGSADQSRIKQVVSVELDLLVQLKRVCDKHSIHFFMIYGTLLGAVRHGGVIPDDDDIDVALMREDYDRLMSLESEFSGKYFLQTNNNDACFFGGYAKLRNKETTAVHEMNRWSQCCEGVSIDIFPIDEGYSDGIREWIKSKRICYYQRLMYAWAYGEARNYRDMPLLIWKGYKYLGKFLGKEYIVKGLHKAFVSSNHNAKSPLGIYTHYISGKIAKHYEKEWFNEYVQLQYENLVLDAPAGYKNILIRKYGKDYMSVQMFDDTVKLRHGLYDVERPYTEYQGHVATAFSHLPRGKKIALIGDAALCAEYIKRHGVEHKPEYWIECATVEVEFTLSEELRLALDSIPRRQVDDIQPGNTEDLFFFACGFDYIKMAEIMRKCGYNDYFYFHYDAQWLRSSNPSRQARQYFAAFDVDNETVKE